MATLTSDVDTTSLTDASCKPRLTKRCTGCRVPHENHAWGQPGPHCQGNADHESEDDDDGNREEDDQDSFTTLDEHSSQQHVHFAGFGMPINPSASQNGSSGDTDNTERLALESKLRHLALEERRLAELDSLRKKVADKEATVLKLRQQAQQQQQQQHPPHQQKSANVLSSGDPRRQQHSATAAPVLSSLLGAGSVASQPGQALPIGGLGTSLPSMTPATSSLLPWQIPQAASATGAHQQLSLHDQFLARSDQHADMFLAPTAVPLGEKVLRVVDFISSLVPKETEQTISDMGGSRLLISYGQQRPRLESVSLSQWVVANTRIFHSLLFSCKLPTSRDVRDYLAYTVKIMELAGKYEWTSVLKFDDEFRQLQATYSFPWSHDSTHLHQITLVPKAKPKQNNPVQSSSNQPFVGPNTAVYSADNKVICRKFNSTGCQNNSCYFAHVCSRKVKGKACSNSHPATQHGSPGPNSG